MIVIDADNHSAEVEERRKPGSTLGKRKASSQSPGEEDEESSLQRAVKKLIRQAQLEADSPSQAASTGSGSHHTPQQNTNTSLPHMPSPTPRTKTARELDMRIFSDTPRDRPVFGAYPMVNNNNYPIDTNMASNNTQNQNGMLNIPVNSNTGYGQNPGLSPFSYPQDPSLNPAFNFPTYQTTGTPQLDPAVESMLASYFPAGMGMGGNQNGNDGMGGASGNNGNGQAGQPGASVPDDFLSRVFNFGWEGPNMGMQGQMQDGNNGNGMQQMQGMAQGVGQGGGQGQSQGSGVQGQFGFGGEGMDTMGNFDGWSSHGWMA